MTTFLKHYTARFMGKKSQERSKESWKENIKKWETTGEDTMEMEIREWICNISVQNWQGMFDRFWYEEQIKGSFLRFRLKQLICMIYFCKYLVLYHFQQNTQELILNKGSSVKLVLQIKFQDIVTLLFWLVMMSSE